MINKLKLLYTTLPRVYKFIIISLIDCFICIVSIWIVFFIQFNNLFTIDNKYIYLSCLSLIIFLLVSNYSGLYKVIIRYIGVYGIYQFFKACFIYAFLFSLLINMMGIDVPVGLMIYQPILLFTLGTISRLLLSNFFYLFGDNVTNHNIVIYGAGIAGRQIASVIKRDQSYNIVGFCDDNVNLHKMNIGFWKIYNPNDIEYVVKKNNVNQILLAIPSLSFDKRKKILDKLKTLKIKIKTLPDLSEIISKKISSDDIKELNILDLLDRDQIKPNLTLIKNATQKRIIIVTGAGGSIGSEICRQLIKTNVKTIVLIDFSEVALYKIDFELRKIISNFNKNKNKKIEIVSILASVSDFNRINEIIKLWKPDVIYHSAAYKHVPLVEKNISEGIKNNIFGTINIAQIAMAHKVKNFILISTDKAVRPTNIMGATKRVSELYLQALDEKITKSLKNNFKTIFSIVRFGNVLDSSGSVVPLFREQIQSGGPITITHKDVERYFMTIPEASELVIQSTSLASGGDVFVLGMGSLVKIYDLAVKMVELSGLSIINDKNPFGDIDVKFTGLRVGEKMFEELLINQKSEKTLHPKIIKGKEDFITYDNLLKKISNLKTQLDENNIFLIRSSLKEIVNEFSEVNEIEDYIYKKIKSNVS